MRRHNIVVNSMEGIGDCVYQRPFVKALTKHNNVYLTTFLPQLFSDIQNVGFLNPMLKPGSQGKTYRTQQKQYDELLKKGFKFNNKKPARVDRHLEIGYGGANGYNNNSIFKIFFDQFGVPYNTKLEWTLPDFKDLVKIEFPNKLPDQKIAVIRPPTVRKEWKITTRNARGNYIAWCCKVLREAGYYTVSIADLKEKEEWIEGEVPQADLYLHKGELGIFGTMGLIQMSSIVVGGAGFITPTSISAGVPLFTIFGGRMGYDNIYNIIHPSMDLTKLGWAIPSNPCRCILMKHDCDKTIKNLDEVFFNFLQKIQYNDKNKVYI